MNRCQLYSPCHKARPKSNFPGRDIKNPPECLSWLTAPLGNCLNPSGFTPSAGKGQRSWSQKFTVGGLSPPLPCSKKKVNGSTVAQQVNLPTAKARIPYGHWVQPGCFISHAARGLGKQQMEDPSPLLTVNLTCLSSKMKSSEEYSSILTTERQREADRPC